VAVVGLSFLLVKAVAAGRHHAAETFNQRGNSYAKKGEYDRAIQDFDQALKVNSNDADALTTAATRTRARATTSAHPGL
jgi:tetratricopeptide (TPR) repeat protein